MIYGIGREVIAKGFMQGMAFAIGRLRHRGNDLWSPPRKRKPKMPNWFIKDSPDFDIINAVEDESLPDRAVGIIATAFMEDLLTERIRQRVRENVNDASLFIDPGALSAFGIKVEIGYLLGIYSEDVRYDLKVISKIRNEFAHKASHRNFDSDRIRDLCGNLRTIGRLAHEGWLHGGNTPFEAFIVGGSRPVPTKTREVFVVTVQLLMCAFGMLGGQRPPEPEF